MIIGINNRHEIKQLYLVTDPELTAVEIDRDRVFPGFTDRRILCYCYQPMENGGYSMWPFTSDYQFADIAQATEDMAEVQKATAQLAVYATLTASPESMDEVMDILSHSASSLSVPWTARTEYRMGEIVEHEDLLYMVVQTHTAQAHQPPSLQPAMLAIYRPFQVDPEEPSIVLEWVCGEDLSKQGSNNDGVGVLRRYGGVVYITIQDPGANIWAPPTVPALWAVYAA